MKEREREIDAPWKGRYTEMLIVNTLEGRKGRKRGRPTLHFIKKAAAKPTRRGEKAK